MTIAYVVHGYRQIWTPDPEIGTPSLGQSAQPIRRMGAFFLQGFLGIRRITLSRHGLLRPETMTRNPNPNPDVSTAACTLAGILGRVLQHHNPEARYGGAAL
ncbi:hypothetical protein PISL3812_06936 [Talaromyces islandicus]|uniref:Uncharacterized protein n=1 Tax=Talaromyces islandicus TaxID=28573 RepID=A0A0U1M2V5_TALIS|nr:hypothetical protein PISL3812_06936 [Talaromyces islandicus]